MKKVVIYKRVSSDVQSYERQEADTLDYARRNEFEVVQIFEEKISGSKTTKNRPALTECMNYILTPTNNIHGLLITELSRLGRNNLDVITNVASLNDAKVCVYSISQNLITLNEDGSVNSNTALVLNILSSIAEQERVQLINRVQSGIKTSLAKNHTSGGGKYNAYGYTRIDKKYVIVESEAKIVRKIFDLYVNGGLGVISIAKYLNDTNVPTRYKLLNMDNFRGDYSVNNFKWSGATICNMLKRELYTGRRIYKGNITNIDEELRIISDEDLNAAVTRLTKRTNSIGSHGKYNYILDNSKIYCGLCLEKGLNHVYQPVKRTTQKSSHYKCAYNGKYDIIEQNCTNYRIGIEKLTSSVWYFIRRTNQLLEQIQRSQNSNSIEVKINEYTTKIEATTKELNIIEREEKKILDLYLKEAIGEKLYTEKFNQLKIRIDKYENAVVSFKEELNSLIELKTKLNNLPEQLKLIKGSPYMMKELILQLVKKMVIYPVKSETVLYTSKRKGFTKELYIELYLYTQEQPITYIIAQYNWLILRLGKGEFDYKTKRILQERENILDSIKEIKHKVEIQQL